jgi:dolichol kinase
LELRLHRHGQFRRWLGHALGGDEELGDRAWRRILHLFGALVLVYYALPNNFFVIAPKADILLAALGVMFVLEALRHAVGLELPTIRPYETHRIASFVFFALALVLAVLLFPLPIAAAVILGTAIVDPVAGELRRQSSSPVLAVGLPVAAYGLLAFVGLAAIGGWPAGPSALLAVVAAPIAVAVERPKWPWVDDDLMMTFLPGLFLYAAGVLALGLPG